MGQCPVSTDYAAYSVDDEDFSVRATPRTFLAACTPLDLPSTLDKGRCSTRTSVGVNSTSETNTNTNSADFRRTFLKVHRPDISQRCLVDPDEVKRILSQQADEILKRRGLIPIVPKRDKDHDNEDNNEHDARDDNNGGSTSYRAKSVKRSQGDDEYSDIDSRLDGGQSVSGFASEYGGAASSTISGITTATRSTIITGNIKPTKTKKTTTTTTTTKTTSAPRSTVGGGSSRWKSRNRMDESSILSSYGDVPSSSSSASALNSVAEQDEDSDDMQEDETEDENSKHKNTVSDAKQMLANTVTKLDPPAEDSFRVPVIPKSFLGRLMEDRRSETDVRRSQYMTVLRLKVTANLGLYFTQRYLTMFPDRPKPFGYQHQQQQQVPITVPDLATLSSSDSSTSSAHSRLIDFGAMPRATVVKCSITDEPFLDLAITGSLGLVPRDQVGGKLSEGSQQQQQQQHYQYKTLPQPHRVGNPKNPDHYVVLIHRRSGLPLAVCAMKAAGGSPIVRIYATRQRVFAQKAAATTHQLGLDWADDVPLYTWAEVVSAGEVPHEITFSIYMANGSDGRFSSQPSYKASFHNDVDHPFMMVSGRTDMERTFAGCALLSLGCAATADPTARSSRNGLMTVGSHDEVFFNLDLAQGIDPALLICFTAIVDEVLEKAMRTQCKNHARIRIFKEYSSQTKKASILDGKEKQGRVMRQPTNEITTAWGRDWSSGDKGDSKSKYPLRDDRHL